MRSRSTLLAALVVAAACSNGTTPTAPPSPPPALGVACATDTVHLAPLTGTTVDCSGGTTVTLPGDGASYLIVPELASGGVDQVAYSTQPYTLHVSGAVTGTPFAVGPAPSTRAARPIGPQLRLDALLRSRDRQRASQVTSAAFAIRRGPASAVTAPALGDVRSFQVLGDINGTTYTTVNAALRYAGTNVYLYLDTAAPSPGFSDAQLAGFGQQMDQVMYPLLAGAFGPPTDIDGNGHVVVLLSAAVNGITPDSTCQTQGYVTGFFDGVDFTADPHSNGGEIFYAIVPDPNGTVSCAHTVGEVESLMPAVFLHEVQHMISFGQHALIHHGQSEEGWLDEGLSLAAEELGSQYYETKYPPPSGRTNSGQLFPDSAEVFISDKLTNSYDYLTRPDTVSLTLHSDADLGLDWRAGDWLLMRYVGDQWGQSIFRTLDESALTGRANLEAATGESLATLLGHFGVALYTDSLPGVPRDSIPPQYRFKSRNLRQLYQQVYNVLGPLYGIPSPFPVTVYSFTPNGGEVGSLVPGSEDFYGLTTQTGAAPVTIQFAASGTTPLPAALRPQVSIFRVQ